MLRNILIVGIGGFFGSILRYLGGIWIDKLSHTSFPWGTFFVNIVGSFIIGIVYAIAEKGNFLNEEWRLLLAVGFCGGFTTFSSFAYNNFTLLKDHTIGLFLFNVFGSIAIGVFTVYLGIILVRSIV